MSNPLIFSGATRNRHFDLSGCISSVSYTHYIENIPIEAESCFILLQIKQKCPFCTPQS